MTIYKAFAILILAIVSAPTAGAQCAVAPPSGCAIAGPGHPVPPGSIPSTLAWPAGPGPMTFTTGAPAGGFVLLPLAPGPCPAPLPLGPPLLCFAGFYYPAPVAAVFIALAPPLGGPVTFAFLVPPALRGTGIALCLQGLSFGPAGCARATDGYNLTL